MALGSERQKPNSFTKLVEREHRACSQGRLMLTQHRKKHRLQRAWPEVVRTHLHDARLSGVRGRKDGREVEVVCEHDVLVLESLLHELGICGTRIPDRRPMHGAPRVLREHRTPAWRKVHVDEEHHHAAGSGRSSS